MTGRPWSLWTWLCMREPNSSRWPRMTVRASCVETGWDAHDPGCTKDMRECYRRQWPWRSLEWGWDLWPHNHKADHRIVAREKGSGNTLHYSPSSLWSLHGRIFSRAFQSEKLMCRGSTTGWPELPWTHATGDVDSTAKHASYPWDQQVTEDDGRVWRKEGSTKSILQVCAKVNGIISSYCLALEMIIRDNKNRI